MKNQESISKLKELIKDVKIAMLTTFSEQDSLHSRPMGTQEMDDEGNLWFFTNEFSPKVKEISKNNEVSVTYAHPGNNTYVSILGDASVIEDRAKIEEMWNPVLKAWFPKGLEDPDLALLKIDVTDAEYWDGSSNKMVVLFNMVKAAVTGQTYNEGDHSRLKL